MSPKRPAIRHLLTSMNGGAHAIPLPFLPCRMPIEPALMDAERAASIIVRGLRRDRGVMNGHRQHAHMQTRILPELLASGRNGEPEGSCLEQPTAILAADLSRYFAPRVDERGPMDPATAVSRVAEAGSLAGCVA